MVAADAAAEEVVGAADAVDAEAVDFLAVVFLEEVFLVVFLVDFLVDFLTGINSELEAFSAASFIALALLPAVHASTRAAKRNTFFIFTFYLFV